YYTIREDRYVLPIKSGHKRHVPGIVHGWSASGATVYIEPQPVVEANNRLLMAQADVDKEIRRVLKRLSGLVGEHAPAIRASQKALAVIDLAFAGGHLSLELEASPPVLVDAGEPFHLRAARHPLLVLGGEVKVIPNDILLGAEQKVLVVTGPNTGGKTVALKTVGLCALLTLAGLHVPAADGSRVPVYPGVFSDIGDEQSLDESTSTFSGHIANLKAILKDLRPKALVLLDELVVGTDPLQGAALAQAILEGLAQRDATVVVTTHYEPLKALPFDDARFRNGAVGYDATAERPTYRLALDLPGASSALQTARRLGLDPSMVDRAEALAGPQQRHLEQVIRRLEEELARAHAEREAITRERRRLEVARTEVEATRERLKAKIKDGVERERSEALRHARAARTEMERLTRDLRKAAKRKDTAWMDEQKSKAQQVIEQVVTAQRSEAEATSGPPMDPTGLRVGQRVFVLSLDNEAELLSLPDERGKVEVRAGIMTARVDVGELRSRSKARGKAPKVPPAPTPSAEAPAPRTAPASLDWDELPPQTPSNTVDVRGQRVDEAIDAVERFLDTLYESSAPIAFIIHGHGTGALKRELRGWLGRCRYAAEHRRGLPHEGGDGVTAVRLA
ncbi:MAG: Smr/MutS family protein, partial [Myxococcales bacterium]|nr:Smr/MutS family protein [Myxococcales bacterium]